MINRKRVKRICQYCDCEFLARIDNLGKFCSIGCSGKFNNTKHGLSKYPLYRILSGMKTRCYNIKNIGYKYYGAKGIKICDEWMNDRTSFCNWGILNGYKPGLEIDRINNNGNYTPENCKFSTKSENLLNKGIMENNTSGYKGICFEKQTKMWKVTFKGKTITRTKSIDKAIIKRKEVENVRLF